MNRRSAHRLLPVVLCLCALLATASPAQAAACPDVDLDGYFNCSIPGCNPTGLLCGDCNDGNNLVYPGRTELCNGRDDNCDGRSDEGSSSVSSRGGSPTRRA